MPNGGGYTIGPFYNANQDVASLRDDYNTYAPNFGKQYSIYNGLEMSLNARLRNGVQFQVGSSTGQTVTDNCEIRAKVLEIGVSPGAGQNQAPFEACHNAPGISTRATAAASYVVPRVDVLLSGTFQSSPGSALAANVTYTNAQLQWAPGTPAGRVLSNQATNITLNVLQPGELFGERVNQVDFRVGKILRFGRQRVNLSLDMFNLLNPDTILGYNQSYTVSNGVGCYLVPTSVMTARTVKITGQFDF